MGRYDSPLSIATLFLFATVASVALIFLFDAETESRIEKHSTKFPPSIKNIRDSFNPKTSQSIGEHVQFHTEHEGMGSKRKVADASTSDVHVDRVTERLTSTTNDQGANSIFTYFGSKIKDLFKRHHRVKRSLDQDTEFELNSEWSESEEEEEEQDPEGEDGEDGEEEESDDEGDDRRIGPIALPLEQFRLELPNQSQNQNYNQRRKWKNVKVEKDKVRDNVLSSIVKRDVNFDSNSNPEDENLNVISRNVNGNTNGNPGGNGNIFGGYGGFGPASGSSGASNSGSGSSASSSSFHRIRHAIRKLGGGGLDLSMVERMILDSNPGRFRASSETQDVDHKSNYHVSQQNRNNNNHKNGEKFGFHPPPPPPDTNGPNHFPFPSEQQSRQHQSQSQLNLSPFSSRSSSNRHWKSTDNNHNLSSNDNENDNSFERDRRGGQTTSFPPSNPTSPSNAISASYPSSTVSIFSDALYGSGAGGSGTTTVMENSPGYHGRSGSTDGRHTNSKLNSNSNRQKKKLSSLRSLSPALSVLMEDSDSNESIEQEGAFSGRTGKTNDANSRVEFSKGSGSARSGFHSENAAENQVDLNDEREQDSQSNYHSHHHHKQQQEGEEQKENSNNSGDSTNAGRRGGKRKNHNDDPGSGNPMDLLNMGREGVIGIAIDAVRDVHADRDGKQTTHITDTKRSIIKEDVQVCYKTDDVLIVVAITCCLNFAFVLVVWGCVRWFSISSTAKERDFHHLDCEDGGDSILFHEEQDHEDPCWRAPSPLALDFEGPDKFEHHRDDCCLEVSRSRPRSNSKCRRDSSGDCLGHHHQMIQQSHHDALSPTQSCTRGPAFPMCGDDVLVLPRESARSLVSSLRKPSDRFHFFRQKQYQKNLKEFGLGFGPPLSNHSKKSITRRAAVGSASMYSFQTSDVPHHLQQENQYQPSYKNANPQKSYSHSMEDLRYIHT